MLLTSCIGLICVLVGVVIWQWGQIGDLQDRLSVYQPVPAPPTPGVSLNAPQQGPYMGLRNRGGVLVSLRKLHGDRPDLVEKPHGRDLPSRFLYAETVGNVHYYDEE